MKKYLFLFFTIAACGCSENNRQPEQPLSKTEEPAPPQKEAPLPATGEPLPPKEESSPTVTGTCSRLIFFQPGAEIETTTYNSENREVSKQFSKVTGISNEGGVMVARIEGTDRQEQGKTTNVKYSYKCDGSKIYFDIASLFRTDAKNQDAGFESSLIEYPIHLSEGQTFPDANGYMKTTSGNKSMQLNYTFKERKVTGREKITTPAGAFNCFILSHITDADMDIPGMDEKTKNMMNAVKKAMKIKTLTWFDPEFGIVKMEMYTNDKLSSRNEVTAVKK
jgi:hypothetical protein